MSWRDQPNFRWSTIRQCIDILSCVDKHTDSDLVNTSKVLIGKIPWPDESREIGVELDEYREDNSLPKGLAGESTAGPTHGKLWRCVSSTSPTIILRPKTCDSFHSQTEKEDGELFPNDPLVKDQRLTWSTQSLLVNVTYEVGRGFTSSVRTFVTLWVFPLLRHLV